ncbi:MAG: hypothetical protein J6A69_12690 [Clostridia bacterium]|nr:hypothetical protein [Clostridia bacterium]
MVKQFYTPNCPECMGETDSKSIQNAVDMAKKTGADKVVIPRINERTNETKWVIDTAILLPDDIQIVIDNAYLVQATGCFDNIFRNENFYNEELRTTLAGTQKNIHINGIGNATFDGGVHNGHTESTSGKDGMPHIRVNNMILMANVDGFSVTGLKMKNQRWWANQFIFCCNGLIENITFEAHDDYPNQDGIDIRGGCYNITIKNIYGVCGDDVVALTALMGTFLKENFKVEGKSYDIHHIYISNIMACSVKWATVGLRCMDGMKVHDITIDSVTDISDGINQNPNTMIRIGQKAWTYVKPHEVGDMSRISVRNIHVNHGVGVMINVSLADSKIEDIYCGKDADCAITTSARSVWFKPGAALKNVVIDGVFCDKDNESKAPLIELLKGEFHEVRESEITKHMVDTPEYLENVVISNVNAYKENVILSEYDGGYILK